jgi:dUTPase
MIIEIQKNETFYDETTLPKQGTADASGYDLIATSDPEFVGSIFTRDSSNASDTNTSYTRLDYIQFRTNLKLAPQPNYIDHIQFDTLIFPRSSISKYNLVLANSIGLIDSDYRGEILCRFKYIWQPEDMRYDPVFRGTPNISKIYKKGDAIAQLKISRIERATFVLSDTLSSTARGDGAFGSTSQTQENKNQVLFNFGAPNPPKVKTLLSEYSKSTITVPEKKYSELMKERETIK